MSFGFGVGDILLVSQLAYKLYSTVTSGRRSAARDLKELGDVLFGLRCALDHLGKAAKDISAIAANRQDATTIEMRQKLDTMIDSCRVTLQELDSVTKRYRETTDPGESDALDDIADSSAVGISTNTNEKRSLARFKKNVQVNWMKIRWDIERKSLSEYREKLQAHTDAMNIVLNTFLWSATNRIEADGNVNAEKMQDLQNQALQSNEFLLQLVQEIHTVLLASKRTPSPPPVPLPKPSPYHQGILENRGLASAVVHYGGLHGGNILSINPHYNSFALMAANQVSNPTDEISTPPELPSNDRVADRHSSSTHKSDRERNGRGLPATVVLLNEKRQSIGSKGFKEYQQKYHPPKAPSKPSFLTFEIPTVPQLHDGLTYIFRPFLPTATRQVTFNRDERKKEIVRWTQGLDHLLNSWISERAVSPSDSKETKQAKWNEMVELLVGLNGSIEESDDKMKRVFYQGTEQGGIDGVLDKLQTASKSVRGRKEAEEFEDVRMEWKESQYCA